MIYFKIAEFESPDEPGSGDKMQQCTLDKLEIIRKACRIPFVITSGYRTIAHNRRVGGVHSSSHCKGHAVDIRCNHSDDRYSIIYQAMKAGFNRIGVSGNFIHLDDDPDKPANVLWTY